MKNYSLIIGIDVSKLTLDIVGINTTSNITLKHTVINNELKAIERFFKRSAIDIKTTLVIFENTGIYGHNLSVVCNKLNLDYAEVSALEIHRSLGIKRGKSDKADALSIAKYALSHLYDLKLSNLIAEDIEKLKLLYNQREKIMKALSQFKSLKELEGFMTKEQIKELVKSNNKLVRNLQKSLSEVETLIAELIKSNEAVNNNYTLLRTIPGIGEQVALYLILVTHNFTRFSDARKLACYGGVAPFPYQSGTSIKGRNKVSHLADKKLKSLLNMGALTFKKYDYQMAIYYEKKLAEGKNKMLVINNLRNKLLSRAFAVINRQQPYVNTHKFAA